MSRKLKRLFVEPASFATLFKKGLAFREGFKIIEGLPEDTRLVTIMYDLSVHGVVMVVASEEFEDLEETETIPFIQVTIQTG